MSLQHRSLVAGTVSSDRTNAAALTPEEEGDPGFPSDSLGQEGLAGAGGPGQQDALGQLAAQAREPGRVLQEGHNLLQLRFGLLAALHVRKRLLALLRDVLLRMQC